MKVPHHQIFRESLMIPVHWTCKQSYCHILCFKKWKYIEWTACFLYLPLQELEKLEVERIEWIQQHLRQYTTLRHETDMFNQSVSLIPCVFCFFSFFFIFENEILAKVYWRFVDTRWQRSYWGLFIFLWHREVEMRCSAFMHILWSRC